jgi:phage shock protein A
MTTLNELIEEQQQLQRFVRWLEKRESELGHYGLDALSQAREDLRAVNEKIAKEDCGT